MPDHDLFYSMRSSDYFGTTVDEFSMIVDQGNTLRQIVFSSLGFIAIISLLRNGYWHVKPCTTLGWLLVIFVCWTFLSLSWSENPDITIRRLGLLAMLILGSLAVSKRFSPHHLVLWILFSTFIYLNVGIIAEIKIDTFNPFSLDYRFSGTMHPNSQGVNCVLLFYASLFLLKYEKRWKTLLVVVALEALIFLFLTKSRTSLVLSIIAILIYWSLKVPNSYKVFIVLCLLWLSCLVVLFGNLFFPIFRHAITLGRQDSNLLTLTGRIPLWKQIISYIGDKPILGYGYGCFWSPKHIENVANVQGWTVTHAHSVLLEESLGLGLLGGIIYIVIIFVGIGRALLVCKKSNNVLFGFMAVFLIFCVLDGLLDLTIINPGHAMFVSMIILAGLGFSYNIKQKKEIEVLDGKSKCEC